MFILVIFVLCFSLIALIAVKLNTIPQIDNPIVRCSTTEINTVKTDIIYGDFFKRRYNFHTDVNSEIMNLKPALVPPDKELVILFNHKPFSYMIVRQLNNSNFEKVFESKDGTSRTSTINTPNEPGKYVFSISANYAEGVGIYYFSIEVDGKKN